MFSEFQTALSFGIQVDTKSNQRHVGHEVFSECVHEEGEMGYRQAHRH